MFNVWLSVVVGVSGLCLIRLRIWGLSVGSVMFCVVMVLMFVCIYG